MEHKIVHDEKAQKFYCIVDNLESHMMYDKINDHTLDYYHTYVPTQLRGKKIAGSLLTAAAKYALENNLKVIPSCSYAASFFQRHSEYSSVVD